VRRVIAGAPRLTSIGVLQKCGFRLIGEGSSPASFGSRSARRARGGHWRIDMSDLKTRPSGKSVTAFLAGIRDPEVRKDCRTLVRLMKKVTNARPAMWGASVVGFGRYHYRYGSGREGDWFLTGFSPRKAGLKYLLGGAARSPLSAAPPVTTSVGCLYLKPRGDRPEGMNAASVHP
jgi:hypothetical protein